MKIVIETIPHDQQRYPTVGDWEIKKEPIYYESGGPGASTEKIGEEEVLYIRVSKLSDWRREALVAIHELVEVLLCKHDGVTTEDVDKFDMDFERRRKEGDLSEPGDDPKAPYVLEHCIATGIERILAAELNVSWKEYEEELEALP